jgi:hypothetical protein
MAFLMRVAGIATRVVCDEPGVTLGVSAPSSQFLVPEGHADVTIGVERAAGLTDPTGEKLFDSGVVWRLYRERDDFVFSFTSTATGPAPYRIARFNPSFTSGRIWLNRACLQNDAVLEPLEYPLDELLMINLLARGRGVEVHACGVIDQGGAAYVFAGPSEAGKSTMARLWHGERATVLSDDRVILRVRDGQVRVYGTPWHGEQDFACAASAPLERLFFLEQGRANGVRPIKGVEAAARLVACSFAPFHDAAGLDFTLDLLERIVDYVPCFVLTFVPEPSVVSFVRARS